MRSLSEHEIEGLKWEYLKHSGLYREYCEWQRNKTQNPKLPLPEKFQPLTGPRQDINPIVTLYWKYGDIHKNSFDDWHTQYYGGAGKGGTLLGSVEDLSGADPSMKYFMRNTFRSIIWSAQNAMGREPSLLEMADLLCFMMRKQSDSCSYLKITQTDFSKAEVERLVKKVKDILLGKVPLKRFVKHELSRYLRVYTMRTCSPKLTYKQIREKEFPVERRIIIKNIENDIQVWW